jgi:ATP-dependent 26S proteasome regulatory subunit
LTSKLGWGMSAADADDDNEMKIANDDDQQDDEINNQSQNNDEDENQQQTTEDEFKQQLQQHQQRQLQQRQKLKQTNQNDNQQDDDNDFNMMIIRKSDGQRMTPKQALQYEQQELKHMNIPALQYQLATMHQLLDDAIQMVASSSLHSSSSGASTDSVDGWFDRQPDLYGERDDEYSRTRVIMSRIVEQAKNIGIWFSGFFHWHDTPERTGYW